MQGLQYDPNSRGNTLFCFQCNEKEKPQRGETMKATFIQKLISQQIVDRGFSARF